MSAYLDERYFIWLYSSIGSVKAKDKSKTHWSLARQLFKKEFIWIIPNDDNRIEDGKDLRREFLKSSEIDGVDRAWLNMNCSMLELLVVLSRISCFEADGDTSVWFWHLMRVLDLDKFT